MPSRTPPSLGNNPTITQLYEYYLAVTDQNKPAAAELVKAHVASEQPALPITTGIAVVWTGEVDAVPAGWALCGVGGQPANPSTLSSGYWIVKITI